MKIEGLGYAGFHALDPASWTPFAEELLGLAPTPDPRGTASAGNGMQPASAVDGSPKARRTGSLHYRLDARSWRIAVHPAAAPGLAYLGWEVADARALDAARSHLVRERVALESGVPPAERDVADLVRFRDPDGFVHEIFYGARDADQPFASPAGVSGFVTEHGMGHVLFVVADVAAAEAWYARVLGLRATDRMDMGMGKRAVFLRCNARHHAVAITDVLPQPMFHHLMIEAAGLEDVGRAWDRVERAKGPVMMTIGQHANDPMLSFYLTSPSGCGIEFGCGGTLVDDARWQTRQVGPEELWGHRGPTMDAIEAGGGRA